MPTGYTDRVGTGEITSLQEFALLCARGMGALISMRDEPLDAPIPEFLQPNHEYYTQELEKAQVALEELKTLTTDQAAARAEAEYQKHVANEIAYKTRFELENARYRDMIEKVKAWTTEAEGIKRFMLDQLEISIYKYVEQTPQRLLPEEWLALEYEHLFSTIIRCKKEIEKECERIAQRNAWLSALRRSLPDD